MNLRLPSVTAALRSIYLSAIAGFACATVGLLGATAGLPSSVLAEERSGLSGSDLVGQAARRVQQEPALSADLRYKIDAFGHELVGQGTYRQLGRGPEKLLRLELKVQVADQALTRQEICGPQFYWIRRESPFAAATLGRVNLRQVRQAAAQHQPDAPARAQTNPGDVWMLLGGLPKLLEGLHDHFDFDPPTEDELQFTGADGQSIERLPVLVVRGRWKPKVLSKLINGDPQKTKLPEQLPDEVELLLGRPEQVLPLFPYRVTYWKRANSAASGQGRGGELRPLMTMELFNVYRKGDIDPREFDYNPGDQEVADLTPGYLQRLGLAPKTR